jgi:hypothetical protein
MLERRAAEVSGGDTDNRLSLRLLQVPCTYHRKNKKIKFAGKFDFY